MPLSLDFFINVVVLLAQLYLGLIVILHNPKSFSHRFFLVLVFFIAFQGIIQSFVVAANQSINFDTQSRLSLFTVPAQLLFLFLFLLHFPKDEIKIKSAHLILLYIVVFGLMFLITTPLVFEKFTIQNEIATPVQGPLFPVFAIILGLLVLANIITIIVRFFKSQGPEKRQILMIGIGVGISFVSLLVTQFILPNYFGIAAFLRVISLFTLPMLIAIGYAIVGYRIFSLRIIPAEVFTLLTWVLFLLMIFFKPAEGLASQIAIFAMIILLGIFLTRNITTEVKRRDELQRLKEELEVKNKRLEELDAQRAEWLGFASPQGKSPMAVVKGYAQLICRVP